ncbi:hypothetical protein R9X47_25080 [Wukongibacter baidiensis]|uniref:nuclear transport factor 2 family protein n=1 Tax=Wukongibacter baidiensis TaxID=1723361 RepID=UPI003D7F43DA
MKPEDLVQKQLEYYNSHDIEGFVSTYSSEIEIINLEDNSIMLKGHDELKKKYTERFDIYKVHADVENRIVIGNKVIDHEFVTGLKENEIVKAVAIYEIERDLISRVWFVFE